MILLFGSPLYFFFSIKYCSVTLKLCFLPSIIIILEGDTINKFISIKNITGTFLYLKSYQKKTFNYRYIKIELEFEIR